MKRLVKGAALALSAAVTAAVMSTAASAQTYEFGAYTYYGSPYDDYPAAYASPVTDYYVGYGYYDGRPWTHGDRFSRPGRPNYSNSINRGQPGCSATVGRGNC